jgi:hypothetical protein
MERSALADDAWRLLDDRLYRPYISFNWDRCRRIIQTTADLFTDRQLDPRSFASITARDDVFERLIESAAYSYRGQRFLMSVRQALAHDGDRQERLRMIKRAIW